MSNPDYQSENPIPDRVARLYDESVPDWPGEIAFYNRLVDRLDPADGSVLEIACGTGRVTNQIAERGVRTVGIDVSQAMLDVAASGSAHLTNVEYVCADMRGFELHQKFELAISPGHSFMLLLTPQDQLDCLASVRNHLKPNGRLVLHLDQQNIDWLGRVAIVDKGRAEQLSTVTDPETGNSVERTIAWFYDPPTQTNSFTSTWREVSETGESLAEWSRGPVPVHCIFPSEAEHLLGRAGFEVEALYGDFDEGPLTPESEEMIWVARVSD